MNITNSDYKAIERALRLLPQGEEFNALPENEQKTILNAELIMIKLYKKRKANNKRAAEYIAEKRKTNKNYAR